MDKSEVENLCCQLTHCIRLKQVEHEEEDILYNIFVLHAGQDCEFMCRWLKFFMTEVYKKNFASAGFDYLKSKGLNLTD